MKPKSLLLQNALFFALTACAFAQADPNADQQIQSQSPATAPQILPPGTSVTPSVPPPRQRQATTENVSLTFPRNSVLDILNFYESLTGKRIIRDSNLAGNELSILIAKPVSREEAIAIIESSLLMNNYSIVPVDDQTVKILGPSRAPRTEGLPLYN
ncbi:MAG: hypothetical protein ACKOLA_08825, partial [Spartobacteria bacterium]